MIEKDDRRITIRKPAAGQAGRIFQAAGVSLPLNRRKQAT